ncbi:MAG: class I SAM-dependent methyltransferase [Candidatus Gastranaerophilales bacterium]|nr:class I SAM-dependent methyltransferase [Candidatus Gastranaerophilales bacterium]
MNTIYNHEGIEKQKNGISSYNRFDVNLVFEKLDLKAGSIFLDLGCGAGDYSIRASQIVGDSGLIYALDQWREIENRLNNKAKLLGIKNLKALTSDIKDKILLDNQTCDVCFICTVIHGIDLLKYGKNLFKELHRIIKKKGKLAIIEIKKEEASFGPPMQIRLSPDELEKFITEFGFKQISYTDLNSFYMIQFEVI